MATRKKKQAKPKHKPLTQMCIDNVNEFWNEQPETMDLQQAVDHVAKDLIKHFKTDKHNIDANLYSNHIAHLFIGVEPMQLLTAALSKYADLEINDKHKLVFVAKNPKKGKKK